MLRLLLLTLGTWSLLSLFLVGTLGFLLQLRQQRKAPATRICVQPVVRWQ